MNFFKYCICFSIFLYSGCSKATSESENVNFSCPHTLSSQTKLLDGWVTVGKPSENLKLRVIGIINQDSSDVKSRMFSEEIIDEWEDFEGRTESVVGYDETHENIMLKCTYARTESDTSDHNANNIILLVPLPSNKAVSCLLVRRDIDPTHEISCKVK